jgi:predicted MFS family arabinose efflux permease
VDAQRSTLLHDRNYLLYVLGNTISWLGTWAQRIGIGWLSWDLTHQSSWVGAISLAQLLPLIVFGPLFGALLDRHDHRRFALSVNLALAFLALVLYLFTMHAMRIELLCAMAILLGITNGAYQAVRLAMVNDIVASQHLSTAIAVNSLLFNVTRAVGPAIAGIIIARYGVAATFAVNAVSFIGVLVALLFVRVRPRAPARASHGLLAESRAGLRYVLQHPELRQFMLLSGITALFGRGIIELLPAFADAVFHRGSIGLANLTTAIGIGAIAGAAVLSRTSDVARVTRMASFSVGGAICLFGLCTAFWAGLTLATLLGFVVILCGVGLQVRIQTAVGDQFRGRVLGLWSAVNVAGPGVGGALGGLAAQIVGLQLVTIVCGLACLALVACIGPRSARR